MNIKETSEFLRSRGLHPNKKLGQNFLCNEDVILKIAESLNVKEGESVLEIGPGTGRLTEKLAFLTENLTIVEIDNGLYNLLRDKFGDSFQIIHSDFLKWTPPVRYNKVIGNLPYYCSSEILFKIAADIAPERIIAMLQKEMADRLLSKPGAEGYGAITVTLNYYYSIKRLFNVDKSSFYPIPDVTSTVISLEKNTTRDLDAAERALFHLVVKSAFWGRRKTLLKTLCESPHLTVDREAARSVLNAIGFDEKVRGENLSTDEFAVLTRELNKIIGGQNEL
jgi:16S rRNA (adenine1518-N6/adenine1519-N6)-dimethyltransferase